MPARNRPMTFSQWESDLLVYEVATLIRRRSANNELMLCVIGASLSALAREMLAIKKCSIKRFISEAKDDFRICGNTHVPTAMFIGNESRLDVPTGLPQEHAQEYHAMASDDPMERQQIVDEILCILTRKRNSGTWVSVAHIISRLTEATRAWLRDRRWKVTTFVADTPIFEISMPRVGRAKVRVRDSFAIEHDEHPLAIEYDDNKEESPAMNSESCTAVKLTRSCLRGYSTVSTDVSPVSSRDSSSGYGGSPAAALRHLIATTGTSALAAMLSQNMPECYEE